MEMEQLAEEASGPRIVFLGDSLTAGFGLDEQQAFPALLGEMLAEEGRPARIVNAGVSGDTTAGGLSRIAWLLRQEPDVLVLALGANDGLRGLDPETTEENLRSILRAAIEAGARVLLCGMLVPPNYGPGYSERFAAMFPRLAEDAEVAFLPFLLEGVAGVEELNQADGIHPTAEGQRLIAAHVLPALLPLLPTVAPAPAPAATGSASSPSP